MIPDRLDLSLWHQNAQSENISSGHSKIPGSVLLGALFAHCTQRVPGKIIAFKKYLTTIVRKMNYSK